MIEKYTIEPAYPKINGKEQPEVTIQGKGLFYSQLANLDGLQCMSTTNYKKIGDKCKQVVDLIKEINELNKI